MPQVVVLIVCHNGRRHLTECLDSVLASDDGPIIRRVVVVDNASTDGSFAFLAENYPQIDRLGSEENRGFAGGNNMAWEYVCATYPDIDFVTLLNQDTIVKSGWLKPMADYLQTHPIAGAAQAKVMLHPQVELFNTAGNHSHFLGFGFTTGYMEQDSGQYDQPRAIDFASGAAVMLRAAPLRKVGLFDEMMFLYLEDADLGWKLRQMGYETVFVPGSVVWHKYSFQSGYRFYYYLERNRWWLLATYYKTPTLLLLLPAIVAMEIGQLYFAARHCVLGEKIRACSFFLDRRNLARLVKNRTRVQLRRRISDHEFLAPFSSDITFPELKSKLLKRIGNPLLAGFWSVARRLIIW